MEVLDSHHHFWHYTPEHYGWIDDSMSRIRRDFLIKELREAIGDRVDGVITVQVREQVEENRYLLDLAEASDGLVRGVVGWLPLRDPTVGDLIDETFQHRQMVGLREIIQGQHDDEFLTNTDFDRGLAELTRRD